jgi:peptidoglycan hydrolase-like protein with peptidoglycan-binding domain
VVKAYQKQAGLSVDGKVGKSTWQALLRTLQAQQQVMGAIPPNSALSYSIVGGTALTAAVAAALLWKKHRAIGFFSGLNVGYGLGEVFTGRYVSGVSQVLVGAAGAAAGAAWSNSKGHDNLRGAFGYIGGTLAATTVTLPIVFKLRK